MGASAELKLRFANGRTNFAPGETVDVEAEWKLDEPPTSLEVRLVWYTRGKGDTDIRVVRTVPQEMPGLAERRLVQLRLPAAPYSFSGKLVSLVWAVELLVEPNVDSARLDFTLAPAGREIVLYLDGKPENAV